MIVQVKYKGYEKSAFSTNISLYFENGTRYGHSYVAMDPARCFSFQKNKKKRLFDPETVFYVAHKLCVSIALFIVCKITQSCIVYV